MSKDTDPLVSILIPTYNRASYLRSAIQSALTQTYGNIEVLILDDASPDETPQVAAEFMADKRVQYIRHSANLGIVGNWKAGIEVASGDFFCLLHDDDLFDPQFVAQVLPPLLADPQLVLAFSDHWIIDASGRQLQKESDAARTTYGRAALPQGRIADFARAALVDISVPIGATLFRRSIVTPAFVREEAKGAVDDWLLLRCVQTRSGAFYVPQRLMSYRVHSGGMNVSMEMHVFEGRLFCCRQILADPQLLSIQNSIRSKLAKALRDYGFALLTQSKRLPARSALGESLTLERHLKASLGYGLTWAGGAGTKLAARLRRS